ncbi:putative bifunctional diguanylate cyclase/phosphodiesterase [Arthrobacter agilis]|uniref:putative bifunctional diguanylate cyclase/phosphodiesterase n=1 Tax=Arthrobacter agilis TaxID=37921 RepID=UPI00277EE3CE|nr:EAL domain-containing protein [Arthrobacter agilis]MDQ0737083.1 diguanylate cyclase (GGDEF)-like protein [Arthrobacter agilis]
MGADARVAGRAGAMRADVSRVLVIVTVMALPLYIAVLLLGDPARFNLFGAWLGMVVELGAVAVCVSALRRTRWSQWQILFGAAAVAVYTAGDLYYLVAANGEESLAVVSVADVAYLLFYPFMIGALAVTVRKLKGVAWPLLLDSLVGALAAASLMAVILAPVLRSGATGGTTLEVVLAVIYPLLDLLLVTTVGGLLASRGLDLGPRWPLLIAGLILFSAADIAYALGMADYAVGTVTDAGWIVGLVGIAVWVDGVARSDPSVRHRDRGLPALTTLMVSTVSALAVLIIGCQVSIPLVAQVLAALTLLLTAAPLLFRNRMLGILATTDELTGLPNRRGLVADLPRRVGGNRVGALLFMDLDRFKDVNDALGHDVGDALLVQVSERFTRQVRSSDLLARLGGDEFAVFLNDVSREEALIVARRLEAELDEPIQVGTASLKVSVSIGIALTPDNGTDVTLLMRKADIAMFRAKSDRSGHHIYSSMDDDGGARKLKTLEELRLALVEGQFELNYQPKVNLPDGAVTSVEALIRWNHPLLGQLPPTSFLPLAEEAGLMPAISALVLRDAVEQAARWRAEGLEISVAVNLSGSCIQDGLPRQIRLLLEECGTLPECLMLEITEDMLMRNPAHTAKILARLRAKGIQISIDDFGTGYSSLAYLRDLPADELKLDRSFITAMRTDRRAQGLVGSIIDLAHSLDLRVVAEGVDNEATRAELRALGCDLAQGFHFARPLPAAGVAPWISAHALATDPDGSPLVVQRG